VLIPAIIETLRATLRGRDPGATDAFDPVSTHWRASLTTLAQNEAQASAFEALASRAEADFEKFETELAHSVDALATVHADYDADLEAYLVQLQAAAGEVVQRQRDMVDLALEVRALIGDDTYEAGPRRPNAPDNPSRPR